MSSTAAATSATTAGTLTPLQQRQQTQLAALFPALPPQIIAQLFASQGYDAGKTVALLQQIMQQGSGSKTAEPQAKQSKQVTQSIVQPYGSHASTW